MLPFLDSKKITTMVVGGDKPSMKPDVESDSKAAMEVCAGRIFSAIESKDKSSYVSAMKDLYSLIDSEEDASEGMDD